MAGQGILKAVQPGGGTKASPVLWQRKKSGELRLCADSKTHINGKVMDEEYTIPNMETIFQNLHGASYFGRIDLSCPFYQIELYEQEKDIFTINTSRDCSRCADYLKDWRTRLQTSRIASNQLSKESKMLWAFKTVCWSMELPRSSSTRECLKSWVDCVRKILLLMRKII